MELTIEQIERAWFEAMRGYIKGDLMAGVWKHFAKVLERISAEDFAAYVAEQDGEVPR